jgi:hypothetical protein
VYAAWLQEIRIGTQVDDQCEFGIRQTFGQRVLLFSRYQNHFGAVTTISALLIIVLDLGINLYRKHFAAKDHTFTSRTAVFRIALRKSASAYTPPLAAWRGEGADVTHMIGRSVRLVRYIFTCHCDQIIFTSVEVAARDVPGYARTLVAKRRPRQRWSGNTRQRDGAAALGARWQSTIKAREAEV